MAPCQNLYEIIVFKHVVTDLMRQEASVSICNAFFQGRKTSKVYAMVNRYNTGKTNSNPKASVGLRSANNIQQGKAER